MGFDKKSSSYDLRSISGDLKEAEFVTDDVLVDMLKDFGIQNRDDIKVLGRDVISNDEDISKINLVVVSEVGRKAVNDSEYLAEYVVYAALSGKSIVTEKVVLQARSEKEEIGKSIVKIENSVYEFSKEENETLANGYPDQFYRLITPGVSGNDVVFLQQRLNEFLVEKGYNFVIKVDGIYGAETQGAVLVYCQYYKLNYDGNFGVNKMNRLLSVTDGFPAPFYRLITPNTRGDDVKFLQQRLNEFLQENRYSLTIREDGVYGTQTQSAVQVFCQHFGLYHDGNFGTNKMAKLLTVTDGKISVSQIIKLAVIDTGVSFTHPDLQGIFIQGYDFVDRDTDPTDPNYGASHGTHCIGTIAAVNNNGIGVAGVICNSFGIRIMPVRVLDASGYGTLANVAAGIRWAVDNGAKIISMSLGGSPGVALRDAIKYAYSMNVTVICSAGNDYTSTLTYPTGYIETIAVGATRYDNRRAYYSNYNSATYFDPIYGNVTHRLDIVAPGGDATVDQNGDGMMDGVLSTTWTPSNKDTYMIMQGTSMAAPHVSAVAALLYAKGYRTPEAIKKRLTETAYKIPIYQFTNGWNPEVGYGLLDAYKALR